VYIDGSTRQILVSKNGAIRVCDVGNIVACVTPAFNYRTFRYTAPELAQNKVLPSVHTGRFSLGVILFELLCVDHPLLGRNLPRIAGVEDEDRALHQAPQFIYDPIGLIDLMIHQLQSGCIAQGSWESRRERLPW